MFEGFAKRTIEVGDGVEIAFVAAGQGADGLMAKLFDIPAEWRRRATIRARRVAAGRAFLPGHFAEETAEVLV